MPIVDLNQALRILAATKRRVASLDPELAEKLELKEGEVHPFIELPNCFYILLGPFAIHRVFYFPQEGGDVYEAFCTRTLPSDQFGQRLTVAEMLDHMVTTKYLWLPRDSIGLRPKVDEWSEP